MTFSDSIARAFPQTLKERLQGKQNLSRSEFEAMENQILQELIPDFPVDFKRNRMQDTYISLHDDSVLRIIWIDGDFLHLVTANPSSD